MTQATETREANAAHTPEPWEFTVWERHVFVSGGPDNDDIAEFNFSDEATVKISKDEAIANARLFAAAPELLAALKVHEEWARKEHEGPRYPAGKSRDNGGSLIWEQWWSEQLDLCDRANRLTIAAIAKAEGV